MSRRCVDYFIYVGFSGIKVFDKLYHSFRLVLYKTKCLWILHQNKTCNSFHNAINIFIVQCTTDKKNPPEQCIIETSLLSEELLWLLQKHKFNIQIAFNRSCIFLNKYKHTRIII